MGTFFCETDIKDVPMASDNPGTTAEIPGHPRHPMLVAFSIAFFVATLACIRNAAEAL